MLRWTPSHYSTLSPVSLPVKWVFTLLVWGFFVALVYQFLHDPRTFSHNSLEDRFIENISAGLCFTTALIHFMLAKRQFTSSARTLFLLFSVVMFLIGMEEISWFQRILDVETPELFSSNMQNEMNIHNFYTTTSEYLYYTGAFVSLVLLPFVADGIRGRYPNGLISCVLPDRFILSLGVISLQLNYDTWNALITQFCSFSGLFIILYWLRTARGTPEKIAILFIMLGMVTAQVLFLIHGHTLHWISVLTEYKELFITVGLLFHALNLVGRNTSEKQPFSEFRESIRS
ncbi:MAG: hypothetical protein HQL50_01720 [Magnetococcales bacterium]|nr:hypothetical protein [Magnetococcales bacterium]